MYSGNKDGSEEEDNSESSELSESSPTNDDAGNNLCDLKSDLNHQLITCSSCLSFHWYLRWLNYTIIISFVSVVDCLKV